MKYTSRAQLLRDAADSIEIQEKAGIEPMFKSVATGRIHNFSLAQLTSCDPNLFEFPIAVVEGKPVFVGDVLYCQGDKVIVNPNTCSFRHTNNWSWNPPKPKTVMVELLVEDADYWSTCYAVNDRINAACRKALEELK